MRRLLYIVTFVLLAFNLIGAEKDPFSVSVALRETDDGEVLLSLSFSIQDRHFLYADEIKVEAPGNVRLDDSLGCERNNRQ